MYTKIKINIVGGVHIPPDSEVEKYRKLNLCIEEVIITYPHHPVTIVGDFNLSKVFWSTNGNNYFPIMRDGVNNGLKNI